MRKILFITILLMNNAFAVDNSCSFEHIKDSCSHEFIDQEVLPGDNHNHAIVEKVVQINTDGKSSGPLKLKTVVLDLFYAYDCPHCHEALEWIKDIKKPFPNLIIRTYEVKKNPENRSLFEEVAKKHNTVVKGVPTFFIGGKAFVGFYKEQTCGLLIDEIKSLSYDEKERSCKNNEVKVPFLGTLRVDQISLFQFTFIIGLLDGLNPCAMWVLFFLLGLLAYTRSKKKIFLVGGIFVAASGLVYFAFMSAWFNLFLVIGFSKIITFILALVAITMGLINIKEIFWFKKGISLMIPESAKPTIAKRARGILHEKNMVIMVVSTVVLAVFVNFIELGCTIGLPAIFTKILSDRNLNTSMTYFYMALYNVFYVVPLALIVLVFGTTLGHYKMTERQGKLLKLVSGVLMLVLGILMLIRPEILMIGA